MAVTEVHGWYGYYGYWPYYHHGGKLLAPPSIANIDYGKTKIKYLTKSKDIKDNINPYAQYQS